MAIEDDILEVVQTASYQGMVCIDLSIGNVGTTYPAGTPANPCSTYAEAWTIATEHGDIRTLRIAPGTEITLDDANNHTGWTLCGAGIVNLGGATVDGALFDGLQAVNGVGVGELARFRSISSLSVSGLGTIFATDCLLVALEGLGETDQALLAGDGALTINSTCTGGTITLAGSFSIDDQVVGGFQGTVNQDANTVYWAKDADDQANALVTVLGGGQGVTEYHTDHYRFKSAALEEAPGQATLALILKWIENRQVPHDNGDGTVTYVLYDDDDTTPLLTWIRTKATGVRAKAT
jgi:hypothetical protein